MSTNPRIQLPVTIALPVTCPVIALPICLALSFPHAASSDILRSLLRNGA